MVGCIEAPESTCVHVGSLASSRISAYIAKIAIEPLFLGLMMLGGGGGDSDLTCISLPCVFVVCGIFTVATSRLDNF